MTAMTADDRAEHIRQSFRLPAATQHIDQARTYALEAQDDDLSNEDLQTLASLSMMESELARAEVLFADSSRAVQEAVNMCEDRLLYALNLDEVPRMLLQAAGAFGDLAEPLADQLPGNATGYALPNGTVRMVLRDFPTGPQVVAERLQCAVYRAGQMVYLMLPPVDDWQEIAARLRDLTDWWRDYLAEGEDGEE